MAEIILQLKCFSVFLMTGVFPPFDTRAGWRLGGDHWDPDGQLIELDTPGCKLTRTGMTFWATVDRSKRQFVVAAD
jgi:hypothetical protein